MKMSKGVPGAIVVLSNLLRDGATIDPDSCLGPLGPILSLDTLGVYGSNVWLLYKDICGENLSAMVMVLRAHQLGILPTRELLGALRAGNNGRRRATGLDIAGLGKQVCERLPSFRLDVPVAADVTD